ncbi:hypothetical protein DPMN_032096 [Dreissena polymorpha]|uniref:Uncharacterized protein n=1 Tax=Dreissena polymorpha TaxID=45954 RepID=A0A9D4M3J4_DREPO|nr:hypothetical protein DPMN_032057 [Dreissena polymorpha]KAH3868941.1 hypothetical protein DPMN_032096 [Dreissena polymorpha]
MYLNHYPPPDNYYAAWRSVQVLGVIEIREKGRSARGMTVLYGLNKPPAEVTLCEPPQTMQ